jgi:hypothetical protein
VPDCARRARDDASLLTLAEEALPE